MFHGNKRRGKTGLKDGSRTKNKTKKNGKKSNLKSHQFWPSFKKNTHIKRDKVNVTNNQTCFLSTQKKKKKMYKALLGNIETPRVFFYYSRQRLKYSHGGIFLVFWGEKL